MEKSDANLDVEKDALSSPPSTTTTTPPPNLGPFHLLATNLDILSLPSWTLLTTLTILLPLCLATHLTFQLSAAREAGNCANPLLEFWATSLWSAEAMTLICNFVGLVQAWSTRGKRERAERVRWLQGVWAPWWECLGIAVLVQWFQRWDKGGKGG